MQNQKVSTIPPIIENNITVTDPKQKAEILNTQFASKSNVHGASDDTPELEKKDNLSSLENINTSPIEISKII